MDDLRLETMTAEQYAAYAAYACENYARTSPHYRDIPLERSLPEVKRDFAKRLHAGAATPGFFLLAILLRENGTERQIGFFDIGRISPDPTRAYIWNVELDASVRGRGFGKRALSLAEDYLRARDITRVGLNVFADNAVARKLYEGAGFAVTQMNMEKWL